VASVPGACCGTWDSYADPLRVGRQWLRCPSRETTSCPSTGSLNPSDRRSRGRVPCARFQGAGAPWEGSLVRGLSGHQAGGTGAGWSRRQGGSEARNREGGWSSPLGMSRSRRQRLRRRERRAVQYQLASTLVTSHPAAWQRLQELREQLIGDARHQLAARNLERLTRGL
jgi:hypothetical protein